MTRVPNTKATPGFASATNVSTAEELLDRLVAFRPIEVRSVETRLGESDATICEVMDIAEDGTVTILGERSIFWTVVRRQLARATAETPWIAGRLVQSGQAYRLDALTDTDTAAVRRALLTIAA